MEGHVGKTIASMTGYGRAQGVSELGRIVVEAQSINRKFLEVSILLPKDFFLFEGEIRERVSKRIGRGSVSVKVTFFPNQQAEGGVRVNTSLLKQLKKAWEEAAAEAGLPLDASTLLRLISSADGLVLNEEVQGQAEGLKKLLLDTLDAALAKTVQMRHSEGAALQKDMRARLKNLKEWLEIIAEHAQGACQKYRQKLLATVQAMVPNLADNEDRVLREIVVYADKVDISEEITRFRSHLQRVDEVFDAPYQAGRKLDFLMQELNRETNTIASKSSEAEVVHLVVDIKTEIERIREQIQNIE